MANWPAAIALSLMSKARPLDREHAHQVLDGRASCRGVRHPGEAVMRREGDADDLAPAAGDHRPGCHRMRHQPGALDVELHHRAKTLGGDVLGRREKLAARVVDEQIDAAVAIDRLVHQALPPDPPRGCRTRTPRTRPAPSSAAVACNGSDRRPQTTTDAPSRASSRAVVRPRPEPPPVTIATWPSSSPSRNTCEDMGGESARCSLSPGWEENRRATVGAR